MNYGQNWLDSVINIIEKHDLYTRTKIIMAEQFGQANDTVPSGGEKKLTKRTIDHLLNEMNRTGIAGGKLRRVGNEIYGIYNQCYCAAQSEGSPNLCNSTKELITEIFEKIFKQPVEVELKQTIAAGARQCKFVVKL